MNINYFILDQHLQKESTFMFDLEILINENKPCSQSVIKYDFANLVQVYYQNTHSYCMYNPL